MCAIDLELRINKKIKILYTLSYNDFLFNNKKITLWMNYQILNLKYIL